MKVEAFCPRQQTDRHTRTDTTPTAKTSIKKIPCTQPVRRCPGRGAEATGNASLGLSATPFVSL